MIFHRIIAYVLVCVCIALQLLFGDINNLPALKIDLNVS